MNLALFRSLHFVVALLVVAGFGYWLVAGAFPIGREKGTDVDFLLWSGWVAVGFYLVLFLYAVRKYAHKLRISPEFRMQVPIEKLEAAQTGIGRVRARIASGELRNRARILREARRAVREAGAHRVLEVEVTRGRSGGPRWSLESCWRQPLGRVGKWMHAHIYYGIAAAVLVWWHGGGNFTTPMGFLLNGLSYLVILTGLIGIVFWVFGPAWLTRRERDISLEQAFALRDHFRRKIQEAQEGLASKAAESDSARQVLARLRKIDGLAASFPLRGREVLSSLEDEMPKEFEPLREEVRDFLVLHGQRRNVEREWRSLAKVRFCLNVWRAVHVPASVLLLVVVVVHIFSVWWY